MAGEPRVILMIGHGSGFDRGLVAGISQYAADHGPWLFHRPSPMYLPAQGPGESIADMAGYGADGIICHAMMLAEAEGLGLPIVAACIDDQFDSGIPAIEVDHVSVGRLAAEHLMGLGLGSFAFCGFRRMYWSRMRQRSFVRTLAEAGHDCRLYHRDRRRSRWASKAAPVADWLAGLPKPVGLFCANDDLAMPIAACCHARGLRVPDEVAILGVDNDEYICGLGIPPISSVALACEAAGYEAAKLLGGLMDGSQRAAGQRITLRALHVVARQSTDMLAVADPGLAAALGFIRENAHRIIGAADVVAAAGVPHRRLNERFQRVLGHSILREVTRQRIEHIGRLLTRTDLPVWRIARELGYSNHRHIARYFRRATGMTPTQYRGRRRSADGQGGFSPGKSASGLPDRPAAI